MRWWEEYIGRPWARVPEPPRSFTCGELVRHVMRERLGVEMLPVYADPGILRQCVDNLARPELYGLNPVSGQPRPYDFMFMSRAGRRDHVGIAVTGPLGLVVLHCRQGAGVVYDSPAQLRGQGFRVLEWFRHEQLTEEAALCRA